MEPNHESSPYLECEKQWVFLVLMAVSGFFGAFTYTIRGGVFCNAQTGNILLLAMSLGHGEWGGALYYFIPMFAYFMGAVLSESLAGPIKRLHIIRWDTLFILFEMVTVVVIGFIPNNVPVQITQILINFTCSMQYNTFRQAQSVPMATTFCTNHVRQVGIMCSKLMRHKDGASVKRMVSHILMLIAFVVGAAFGTVLCGIMEGRAILVLLIPLGLVFVDLLHADLFTERDRFDETPHGH